VKTEAKKAKTTAKQDKAKKTVRTKEVHGHTSSQSRPKTRVLDITPQLADRDKFKKEYMARERAAMQTLATQRRLTGAVPVYSTEHLKFRTRVFIDRIEYVGKFGKTIVPIEQVAWVKLRAGGTGVIIETVENKRVVMVVAPRDRIRFAEMVVRVQELLPLRLRAKATGMPIRELEKLSFGTDELEKLADLRDKGIITDREFDLKKKEILGL
jgi:hypothetical protein